MNIERLGWVAAAALAGGIIAMGFKAPGDKIGVVDVAKVFTDSDYSKKQNEILQGQLQDRKNVVQFVQANRDMKVEDAEKLRTLSTKENPTAADKTEIDRIKTDAQNDEKKARDLQTKEKPTPAELTQIEEFTRRKDATGQKLQAWQQDFNQELQQQQEKMRTDAITKVRQAIQQVARDQGFSQVFSQDIMPYCANDITADATKLMNKK